MFAFDRSALTVLAPLALLALAIAASNYSPEPRPAQAVQQPNSEKPESEKTSSEKGMALVARNGHAVTRH